MNKIEQVWSYLQQLQQAYVATWQMRLKAYLQTYVLGVWHKVQQQMHA